MALKPNEIFDIEELDPGGIYLACLTDSINASYACRFTLDVPMQQPQFICQVRGRLWLPEHLAKAARANAGNRRWPSGDTALSHPGG
ncbi:MAG: hypothetical protein Q9O62_03370 [Ardenticatenia bacterium]|nr:hypothetical protein [Ardenticatenia bacterium]